MRNVMMAAVLAVAALGCGFLPKIVETLPELVDIGCIWFATEEAPKLAADRGLDITEIIKDPEAWCADPANAAIWEEALEAASLQAASASGLAPQD